MSMKEDMFLYDDMEQLFNSFNKILDLPKPNMSDYLLFSQIKVVRVYQCCVC